MDVRRWRHGATAASIAALSSPIMAAPAGAAVPHTVQPGETLWSIAAANNFTTRTVAAFNGLSETSAVVAGQTIQIPTEAEGASALAGAGLLGTAVSSAPAASAGSHVVQPGETLSGIAAANGLTAGEVAAFNGISAETFVIIGQTIQIPAASGTSASAGVASAAIAQPAPPVPPFREGSTYGLGHIESPSGVLHLDPAAAEDWNAMRDQGLATYGLDIYPDGPVSAFRTYEQQAYFYDQYLNGTGPLAAPPGTSAHEVGAAVDLASPEMRTVIDNLGGAFGWGKIESFDEWWHVNHTGGG
jgi:LysM repeat protein